MRATEYALRMTASVTRVRNALCPAVCYGTCARVARVLRRYGAFRAPTASSVSTTPPTTAILSKAALIAGHLRGQGRLQRSAQDYVVRAQACMVIKFVCAPARLLFRQVRLRCSKLTRAPRDAGVAFVEFLSEAVGLLTGR